MDANGKGHSINDYGNCQPSYNKKTGLWTIKATLKNGSWQDAWANDGLTDTTIRSPGESVQLSVVHLIGNERFAADPTLTYTAKAEKSGNAKWHFSCGDATTSPSAQFTQEGKGGGQS
ncbi:MAG: hypothetical protein ABSD58_06730 [Verrucomicrobiia bacterium]